MHSKCAHPRPSDRIMMMILGGRGGRGAKTSLSKCQVIGSCRSHFIFFHVSEFKNQWQARRRDSRGVGADRGRKGRRRVGSEPFFAGLASIGRRSWRGFACCPGKRTSVRSPKGEKKGGEERGETAREILRGLYPLVAPSRWGWKRRGGRLFVGGTDVWIGVGHAWKDDPRTRRQRGGRGRSAPTYAILAKSIYTFDLLRHLSPGESSLRLLSRA